MSIGGQFNKRLGEVRTNNRGSKMKIIEYNNNKDIVIKFEHGDIVKTTYNNFKLGNIKSAYDTSI